MHKWADCVRAQSRCGLFKAKPANRVCYDLSIHLFDCIAMKCHFFTAAVVALLCSKPVFAEGAEEHKTVTQPAQPASYRCLKPDYPKAAIAASQEGVVEVSWKVDEVGKTTVVWVSTTSGFELLDHAALRAAKKCQFKPKTEQGQAVPAHYVRPFHFQLRSPTP